MCVCECVYCVDVYILICNIQYIVPRFNISTTTFLYSLLFNNMVSCSHYTIVIFSDNTNVTISDESSLMNQLIFENINYYLLVIIFCINLLNYSIKYIHIRVRQLT